MILSNVFLLLSNSKGTSIIYTPLKYHIGKEKNMKTLARKKPQKQSSTLNIVKLEGVTSIRYLLTHF